MQNKKYKSPYDRLWAKIHKKEVKPDNPFSNTQRFPLGTLKPYTSYSGNKIPERDIVYWKFPTMAANDSFSAAIIAKAGTQKTRKIKRIVKYAVDAGWHVLILDPKSGSDWPPISRPKKMDRLHPLEEPCAYPILAGCPSFVIAQLPPEEQKKFEVLDLSMKSFADRKLLATLGFSPGSCEVMLRLISKGLDAKQIEKYVASAQDKIIPSQTKNNILIRMSNIIEEGFFQKEATFSIDDAWDKYRIISIGFFNQDERYISAYCDRILRDVKKRATESNLKRWGEKYLIICDDAHLICGSTMNPDEYSSLRSCISALVLWRSLGVSMIFSSQSLDLLHPEIYGNCKTFFISKTSNLQLLRRYVFNPSIFYAVEELAYNPEKSLVEWVIVKEDGVTFDRYYPFNCPLTHG